MNPKNCITHWLPKLVSAGIPTPETEIITTDIPLIDMCSGIAVDGNREFRQELIAAMNKIGGGEPVFLRSGHFSGKHEWRETCYVDDYEMALRHVLAIIEYGEISNMGGFPWNVWAVRKLLPMQPDDLAFISNLFCGMPVRREFRAFVRDGVLECLHPYWPEDAFRNSLDSDQSNDLSRISRLSDDANHERVVEHAIAAGKALGGYWSVDILSSCSNSGEDWYVTDCALGEDSWHWPGCEHSHTD